MKTEVNEVTNNQQSYIIFNIEDELYGTPLLSIREIVETPEIKPVPYAPAYYLGITNLRGQIISVLDLKKKFQMAGKQTDQSELSKFMMVLSIEDSNISIVIDSVNSVRKLGQQDISLNPVTNSNIDPSFLMGAARLGDQLVTLVDISRLIDHEELEKIRKTIAA